MIFFSIYTTTPDISPLSLHDALPIFADLPPAQRHPPGADRDQRRDPAADPDRQRDGDEHLGAERTSRGRLHHRPGADGDHPRRDGRLLPQAPLALSAASERMSGPWQISASGPPGASPT